MGDDLTPANFIMKIKAMNKRERSKIVAEKLIELILEIPDDDPRIAAMDARLNQLHGCITHITKLANENQTVIAVLKEENESLKHSKLETVTEINNLKKEIQDIKSRWYWECCW